MPRAGSEVKRQNNGVVSVSNQRLIAASNRALEAHVRVQRFAEHLGEELDHITSPHGIPTRELDPEDSMVIAVEKMITTAKAKVTPPTVVAVEEEEVISRAQVKPAKRGIALLRKPTTGG